MLDTIWSSDEPLKKEEFDVLAQEHGAPRDQQDRAGHTRLGIWWNRRDLDGLDEGLEWTVYNDGTIEFYGDSRRHTKLAYFGEGDFRDDPELPEVEDSIDGLNQLYQFMVSHSEIYEQVSFLLDVTEDDEPPVMDPHDWEKFIGDEEANTMLLKPMRDAWKIA